MVLSQDMFSEREELHDTENSKELMMRIINSSTRGNAIFNEDYQIRSKLHNADSGGRYYCGLPLYFAANTVETGGKEKLDAESVDYVDVDLQDYAARYATGFYLRDWNVMTMNFRGER